MKSPLLEADPEDYEMSELADMVEEELVSLASGDYEPEATSENLKRYSFEDSIENENPEWWRPMVSARLDVEDATVEEWMDEAVSRIEDSPYFRVEREEYGNDNLTGEKAPVYLKFGDNEQINEGVTIERPYQDDSFVAPETVEDELREDIPEREYAPGTENVYSTEKNGFSVSVEPDLSSGFFRANVEVGPDTHSSEIWMPTASRDEALLIGTPSQFSPETESTVVSVPDESFTGDPVMDAVSESLGYFLPFMGVAQTEISPEAIDHRNRNHLDTEPYRVKMRSDAWNRFQDLDPEYQDRIQDQIDQIALNPGKTPLEMRDSGKVDQVGSEDIYIKWQEHDQEELVELREIMDRGEAFPKGGADRRT